MLLPGASMSHTVKAVSKIAGVSVRTLHHYDQIGLLKPAAVSAAGYRLYDERDLQKLQQVLFFKELGFDLKEIKRILSDPDFDRQRALVQHRKLLLERQGRLRRLIKSVDNTLKAIQRGKPMNATMFEGFDPTQYEEEARRRWGHTDAWKESQRRGKPYTKEEWAAIQTEGGEILKRLVAVMDRSPSDPQSQEAIAAHHRQINERFYTCTPEIYRGLAGAYANDPGFNAFYEKIKPGLARFMHDCMTIYADSIES